eukprot:scaffold130848_cov18-Prasinocladus_malaysianus.AAC.2
MSFQGLLRLVNICKSVVYAGKQRDPGRHLHCCALLHPVDKHAASPCSRCPLTNKSTANAE